MGDSATFSHSLLPVPPLQLVTVNFGVDQVTGWLWRFGHRINSCMNHSSRPNGLGRRRVSVDWSWESWLNGLDGCFAVTSDWALNGQCQSIWFVRSSCFTYLLLSFQRGGVGCILHVLKTADSLDFISSHPSIHDDSAWLIQSLLQFISLTHTQSASIQLLHKVQDKKRIVDSSLSDTRNLKYVK
ncbi:hypothetical protein TRIATDRAFT_256764 [Trichoderma atroviride IMI 206040]|uniref:Uncharacterized protein n=1 Tax=Hypocrea atroviridis (strain ATCC 20476 / IMI 206040) TaxID=452589 RepID=G9NUW5_HYPAI|nr:uncharacterized protein TRIATDRAFT_299437 [Trichoderma atroviride IMI 206040]EHK45840.1 hypothetical protein TRIATDRAFT_256764 [Trichoderma atroviride IMI 206040]